MTLEQAIVRFQQILVEYEVRNYMEGVYLGGLIPALGVALPLLEERAKWTDEDGA